MGPGMFNGIVSGLVIGGIIIGLLLAAAIWGLFTLFHHLQISISWV
jgi:hypothetical protein